jgi:hypothetical protein
VIFFVIDLSFLVIDKECELEVIDLDSSLFDLTAILFADGLAQ